MQSTNPEDMAWNDGRRTGWEQARDQLGRTQAKLTSAYGRIYDLERQLAEAQEGLDGIDQALANAEHWMGKCEELERQIQQLQHESRGIGMVSKAEVDRIVADALHRLKAQVAKAVFDNDYMWDDLAELGINPELEKESNPDDRVSKADYWFQKYNAMKTAGVDDEEIRDMYDELRLNVAKAVFWQDAYATGLREKEDIRVRIVALGITPELLEKESNE